MKKDEDVFDVCNPGGNLYLPARISPTPGGNQNFFQIVLFGGFEELFVHHLFPGCGQLQAGNPQLEFCNNNALGGAVILKDELSFVLEGNFKMQLHWGLKALT